MKETFYFHRGTDDPDELAESHLSLTPAQLQEVLDASYEIALVYNFSTHKWELP